MTVINNLCDSLIQTEEIYFYYFTRVVTQVIFRAEFLIHVMTHKSDVISSECIFSSNVNVRFPHYAMNAMSGLIEILSLNR